MEAYHKNPYPLRNCIIPNEVTVRAWNLEAAGLAVSGVPAIAELGIMRFLNGYGLLFLSYDAWEWGTRVLGNYAFLNTYFFTDFDTGHGIIDIYW